MLTALHNEQSYLDPYKLDVQAGLGTSLLVQGIFLNANKKSPTIAEDEEQISLLKLATFHLKVASSLCTTSRGPILQPRKKAELDTPSNTDVLSTTAPKEESSDQKNIATKGGKQQNQNVESNAAILHNLALAYIAMGETNSSVPALLRANNIYWNIPEDLLQQTEEKALLMGAKTKRVKQSKKRRIPFIQDLLLGSQPFAQPKRE